MDTNLVAEQFEISRRRVQQLAKQYRGHGNIPTIETPGPSAYAGHPADLEARVLAVHEMLRCGAVAVAHVLRVGDGPSIDNNRDEVRSHTSLDWDALETPKEAFDISLPQLEIDIADPLATGVTADD